MNIMICGSMKFAPEMLDTKKKLEEMGHSVEIPGGIEENIKNPELVENLDANLAHVQKLDLMREGFDLVAKSDAILVLNHKRNGIEGYIGISALMEMGLAYYLRKKIFLLHPVPSQNEARWAHEVSIMQPEVINGNLSNIY